MAKRILLTQGLFALVDDEDYDRLVAMGSWCVKPGTQPGSFYARRYERGSGAANPRYLYMSRVVMRIGRGDSRVVDHINHDTLDNRKRNLRVVAKGENNRNRALGLPSDNTSGFVGVVKHPSKWRQKRWQARAYLGGRRISLGYFETAEEAARVRTEFMQQQGVSIGV